VGETVRIGNRVVLRRIRWANAFDALDFSELDKLVPAELGDGNCS